MIDFIFLKKKDEINDSKEYDFEGKKTRKYLNLTFAKSAPKDFKLTYVSNGPFTEVDFFFFFFFLTFEFLKEEFKKWEGVMKKDKLTLPTRDNLKKKEKNLEEAENFHFTEEDVRKMISLEKIKQNNPIKAKRILLSNLEKAKLINNKEEIERLEKEMEEVEERIKEYKNESEKDTKTIKLREINERNKQINFEKAKIKVNETVYSRRKTFASGLFQGSSDSKDEKKENSSALDSNSQKNQDPLQAPSKATLAQKQKTLNSDKFSSSSSKSTPSEILQGAHKNFDFEFDLQNPHIPSKSPSFSLDGLTSSIKLSSNTQFLTVQEYKRRRGL